MDKYVFFCGKGGVGKTTVSCGYATGLAQNGNNVLLVSTDPAHSLSDVFERDLCNEPRGSGKIEGLDVLELDPESEIKRHEKRVKSRIGDHVSPAIVKEVNRQIELSHNTPGAWEAALFDRVIDIMEESRSYDRVVFDTSPTGATVRLLSLPELLEEWMESLIEKRRQSLDLYEKAAIGDKEPRKSRDDDSVLEHLRDRRSKIRKGLDMLKSESEFYLVLNPDELSINESKRTVDDLADHDLKIEGLFVNKVTPDPSGMDCSSRYLDEMYSSERKRIDGMKTHFDQDIQAVIERKPGKNGFELVRSISKELDS
ncbi:MAG: ArsA family ATPase [Halobacteria archaeon]